MNREEPGAMVTVAINPAELIDKLTILETKLKHIHDEVRLAQVRIQLDILRAVFDKKIQRSGKLDALTADLRNINESLWNHENEIRGCEREQDFGERFIEVARSIYKKNDRRAALKQQIDRLLRSSITEVKSYETD